MGEAKRKLSATKKFLMEFSTCYFCGGKRAATTREHMPPKSLFDIRIAPTNWLCQPVPNVIVRRVPLLTAAVVSRWNYDNGDQERSDLNKLDAQVRKQAPALSAEWKKRDGFEREAREHLRIHGVPVPHDAGIKTIGPETIKQLNLSLRAYRTPFRCVRIDSLLLMK